MSNFFRILLLIALVAVPALSSPADRRRRAAEKDLEGAESIGYGWSGHGGWGYPSYGWGGFGHGYGHGYYSYPWSHYYNYWPSWGSDWWW